MGGPVALALNNKSTSEKNQNEQFSRFLYALFLQKTEIQMQSQRRIFSQKSLNLAKKFVTPLPILI